MNMGACLCTTWFTPPLSVPMAAFLYQRCAQKEAGSGMVMVVAVMQWLRWWWWWWSWLTAEACIVIFV